MYIKYIFYEKDFYNVHKKKLNQYLGYNQKYYFLSLNVKSIKNNSIN